MGEFYWESVFTIWEKTSKTTLKGNSVKKRGLAAQKVEVPPSSLSIKPFSFLYLWLMPIITLPPIFPRFFPFFPSLLSPAGHNTAPLLDFKCSIIGTISPSRRWGPLGLTTSIVGSVIVELHARPISPSLFILYACVCLNVCTRCLDERLDGGKWTYFVAVVPIICRRFSDWSVFSIKSKSSVKNTGVFQGCKSAQVEIASIDMPAIKSLISWHYF